MMLYTYSWYSSMQPTNDVTKFEGILIWSSSLNTNIASTARQFDHIGINTFMEVCKCVWGVLFLVMIFEYYSSVIIYMYCSLGPAAVEQFEDADQRSLEVNKKPESVTKVTIH